MSEEEIKKALIDIHQTQRWLLEKVRVLGFSKLTEPNLSKIIRRKYKGTKDFSDSVLEAVNAVLFPYIKAMNDAKKRTGHKAREIQ